MLFSIILQPVTFFIIISSFPITILSVLPLIEDFPAIREYNFFALVVISAPFYSTILAF
jgi:hypothetical protein